MRRNISVRQGTMRRHGGVAVKPYALVKIQPIAQDLVTVSGRVRPDHQRTFVGVDLGPLITLVEMLFKGGVVRNKDVVLTTTLD